MSQPSPWGKTIWMLPCGVHEDVLRGSQKSQNRPKQPTCHLCGLWGSVWALGRLLTYTSSCCLTYTGLFWFACFFTIEDDELASEGFGPLLCPGVLPVGASGPRNKLEASAAVTQGRECEMATPSPSSLGKIVPVSDTSAALSRGPQRVPLGITALGRASALSPQGLHSKETSGGVTATHSVTLCSLLPFPGLSFEDKM